MRFSIPFTFSAYQTPDDWKLAQEGKEQLYKEVVASYQEKKPKVYALEVYEGQDLVQIKLNRAKITYVGASFRGFARLSVNLTFLATSPSHEQGKEILAFCRDNLAKFKVPSAVEIRGVLRISAAGKPLRRALREELQLAPA